MGGMFSVVMVREGLNADDYGNPGWFDHPEGTVAYEWTGELPKATRAKDATTMTPKRQARFDSNPK